jgi:hypothetical protein
MAFHRIHEAQLFFEMSRATYATENTGGLLDPLEIHFAKGHCNYHWHPRRTTPDGPLDQWPQPWLPDRSPPGRLQRMPTQCRESSVGTTHQKSQAIRQQRWLALIRGAILLGQKRKRDRGNRHLIHRSHAISIFFRFGVHEHAIHLALLKIITIVVLHAQNQSALCLFSRHPYSLN